MASTENQNRPNYAEPPGWILEERLQVYGISRAEFSCRCGCPPQLISEIVAGNAPVVAETSLLFREELGLAASIWLGIERDYRLHLMRKTEAQDSG